MILIDPPNAAGYGRLWSHLASDVSYAELHAFAEPLGLPRRRFDRDHYDVPAEWYDAVVEAGATPVTSRELVTRLRGAGLRRRKTEVLRPRAAGRSLVVPDRLREGSTVAVVATSGPLRDPALLAAGVETLRSWGLDVREPMPLGDADVPWHAAPDDVRADALTRAWLDPGVDAVWCLRGGVGAHRILDLLDWRALASERPKLLLGHSDVTALHQGFAARLGLATVLASGVCGLERRTPAILEATRSLLFDGVTPPLVGTPGVAGRAAGPLVGGNLSVLAAGLGAETVHPAAGSIAVIEDVNEAPYRIDRELTQLLRAGWFEGALGVVAGEFCDCGDPAVVRRLLELRLGHLGVPIMHDAPFGHGDDNRPLHLGVRAELVVDATSATLTTSPAR